MVPEKVVVPAPTFVTLYAPLITPLTVKLLAPPKDVCAVKVMAPLAVPVPLLFVNAPTVSDC